MMALGAVGTGAAAVLASCAPAATTPGAGSPSAKPATKDLKIHLGVAVTSPYTVGMQGFAERVKRRTDGVLNFQIFPGSQLGNDRQALEGMGTHTIAGAVQNNMGGHPAWDMTAGPFLFRDRDHLWKVMRGDIGKGWIDAFLKDQKIRVVQPVYFAPRHISSGSKPIRTPDDLNGFKIRVPDQPVFLSMFRILGANPVPLAFSELYTALQSKTVDGQENPLDTMVSSGFHEVQKNLSLTGHSMGTQNFMLDEQVWSGLTGDQQRIVAEEARVMADEVEGKIVAGQNDYIQKFKDAGAQVIEPATAAFREKSASFWKQEMVTKAWGPDLYDRIQALK